MPKPPPLPPFILVLKALGHAGRFKIMLEVAKADGAVGFGPLAGKLRMPASTLSGHLDLLEAAGLVTRVQQPDKTVLVDVDMTGLDEAARVLPRIRHTARERRGLATK